MTKHSTTRLRQAQSDCNNVFLRWLLDSIGKVFGGSGAQSNRVNEVMGMLNNQQTAGITVLVQKFSGKGLGDIVNSWVGMG